MQQNMYIEIQVWHKNWREIALKYEDKKDGKLIIKRTSLFQNEMLEKMTFQRKYELRLFWA